MSAEQLHRLGFLNLVTEYFSFLTRQGFRQQAGTSGVVAYESDQVWISIGHGRLDYALEIELGRRSVPNELFTLHEVVRALCPLRTAEARYQASNHDSLARGVEQFSNLLRECAAPLLEADESAFHKVAGAADVVRRGMTADAKYAAVRERATLAWEGNKYEEAFRLYSEMREALTASEKYRFRYLAKRFGQGS